MYHQFRINKAVAQQKSKKAARMVFFFLAIFALGLIFFILFSFGSSDKTLPFIIGGSALLVIFIMTMSYKRSQKQIASFFDSYMFIIKDGMLIRRIEGYPERIIYYNDIKSIVKHRKGNFSIHTVKPQATIRIPSTIENADTLEAILQQIHTISYKN